MAIPEDTKIQIRWIESKSLDLGDIIYQLEQQGIGLFSYKLGQSAFLFASDDSSILQTATEVKKQFEDSGIPVVFEVRSGKQ